VSGRPAAHEFLFAGLLAVGAAAGVLPRLAPRLPLTAALAVGVAAGALLYGGLAGRRVPRQLRGGAPATALLIGRAAVEELAWRGFLLGALLPAVGAPAALLGSSGVFALSHRVEHGGQRLVHLLAGCVFGLAYLVTGRLSAAVAAHVVYNGLIAAARRPDGAAA
jgi:membrane protease YdiL (CAAX protease family)